MSRPPPKPPLGPPPSLARAAALVVPTADVGVSSAEGVAEEVEANGCADSAVSELLVVASEVSEAAGVTVEGAERFGLGVDIGQDLTYRRRRDLQAGRCGWILRNHEYRCRFGCDRVQGASGDAGSEVSEVLAVPAVLTLSAVSEDLHGVPGCVRLSGDGRSGFVGDGPLKLPCS